MQQPRHEPRVSMKAVILLTAAVTAFAGLVAFWMYAVAGTLIGASL